MLYKYILALWGGKDRLGTFWFIFMWKKPWETVRARSLVHYEKFRKRGKSVDLGTRVYYSFMAEKDT